MELTGKMGRGWAIRLVGGLIAPATWFPVSLSVGVRDAGERREITVRVDENFGESTMRFPETKDEREQ